jgi:hypothetical protein
MTYPKIACYGDSTTAQSNSWLKQLHASDTTLNFSGGYYQAGYTSLQILNGMPEGVNVDVAVVKVGINDFRFDDDVARVLTIIRQIISHSHAKRVLLPAICPSDITDYVYGTQHFNRQDLGAQLNAGIEATAGLHGWEYMDPDVSFRLPNNGYATGTTVEGVHPTTESYAAEAALLGPAIHDLANTI